MSNENSNDEMNNTQNVIIGNIKVKAKNIKISPIPMLLFTNSFFETSLKYKYEIKSKDKTNIKLTETLAKTDCHV